MMNNIIVALPSVIEMAKWKSRQHAYFSFNILGRLAGFDEGSLINRNFSGNYGAEVGAMVEKCCREKK